MRPLLGKLERTLKSARWKVAVAWVMKQHTSVSNGRLAEQLGMGSGVYVSASMSASLEPPGIQSRT